MPECPKIEILECCRLRSLHSFFNWEDFCDFKKTVEARTNFFPVTVAHSYANLNLEEYWYQCQSCMQIWRLVAPDPPFKGLWRAIPKNQGSARNYVL